MCGRYTQKAKAPELSQAFALGDPDPALLQATYNAAPTQNLPVIPNTRDGSRVLAPFRWGLVPFWAKDIKIGSRLINARGETLREKPAYRAAFKYRRCLVPTTGFFEWKNMGKGKPKKPMFISMREGRPFAFAGLWERKELDDGELLHTFTIITTAPNELMGQLHHRMPVILHERDFAQWLDTEQTDTAALSNLLVPLDEGLLQAWEVDTRVNNVRNDDEGLIVPLDGGLSLE